MLNTTKCFGTKMGVTKHTVAHFYFRSRADFHCHYAGVNKRKCH